MNILSKFQLPSSSGLGLGLKRASYCWKSLEIRGSKLLFPKIRLGECLGSYRLLVETQTIMMASNMCNMCIFFIFQAVLAKWLQE